MPHSPFFRLIHDNDAKIAKGNTREEKIFEAVGFWLSCSMKIVADCYGERGVRKPFHEIRG
jgi:hypothetical protein